MKTIDNKIDKISISAERMPDGKIDLGIHEVIKNIGEDATYHEKLKSDSRLGRAFRALHKGENVENILKEMTLSEMMEYANYANMIKSKKSSTSEQKDYQNQHHHNGIYSENGSLCVELEIKNNLGLHARPSAEFTNIAKKYENKIEKITVYKDNLKANGYSIMGLMTLAAEKGSRIKIEVERNSYSAQFLAEISKLVESGFGENQYL